ncbi:hypothetical protein Esi_0621_0003 [Ectocarpus siliculosus]|uniref:Uncharacterized protein n=1 Tax=Ectocarpus siliculosus TaxID=2880 RepID=D7G546_ECTSI|nr:hypothetical protein Esi_0621_0003 [Ectocarpus siliculosus]|eukprot:CBJ33809.1 hypothetical protein Esi_0621_0003 [Ectocarpus siliculosus]
MQSWRGNQQLYARVERLVRQSSGRTKGAEPPSGRDSMMAASSGAGGEDGGGEPMGSQESRPLGDELDKAADGCRRTEHGNSTGSLFPPEECAGVC